MAQARRHAATLQPSDLLGSLGQARMGIGEACLVLASTGHFRHVLLKKLEERVKTHDDMIDEVGLWAHEQDRHCPRQVETVLLGQVSNWSLGECRPRVEISPVRVGKKARVSLSGFHVSMQT